MTIDVSVIAMTIISIIIVTMVINIVIINTGDIKIVHGCIISGGNNNIYIVTIDAQPL